MLLYTASVLVVLILAGPSVESVSEETCRQYAENGNCDFYTECLEDKYNCGEKGYPVGYGHRYCTRFQTYYNDFNDEGKVWIDDVRKCLMKALFPVHKSQSFDCGEVKAFAFKSHPKCYTDSGGGFCKVFWTNKVALMKVFEAEDFLGEDSMLAIEQILMTGLQCLCDYGLADEIHEVVDATSHVWTTVMDFTTALWRQDPKEEIKAECETKALQGDCGFYSCLERRHPCGEKGFALREGRTMCERLKQKKGLFNPQGQLWVADFTKCLTRSLLPEYRDSSISCRHIHNFGYWAQDNCFIDTGICDLVASDQNEFALWFASDVVDDQRFQLELSTILCRCDKYEGGSRYTLKYSSEHGVDVKQKARVVDQSSPADIPCTSQGGTCQDYTVRTCLAGYETGKCGGNSLRRCCLPCGSSCQAEHQTWSAGDSGCTNAGGQCKMYSSFCNGQYRTNETALRSVRRTRSTSTPGVELCGGPLERKCCVSGWPTFSQLRSNYPLYSTISWDGLVHQEGLDSWLTGVAVKNTCAMRVSRALTHAGRRIIVPGSCDWARVTDSSDRPYIIRVGTMRCYLDNQYDSADVTGSSESSFRGRQGIIIFQSCGFTAATGHVDLWTGSACVGNCPGYFSACSDIRLYEF